MTKLFDIFHSTAALILDFMIGNPQNRTYSKQYLMNVLKLSRYRVNKAIRWLLLAEMISIVEKKAWTELYMLNDTEKVQRLRAIVTISQ